MTIEFHSAKQVAEYITKTYGLDPNLFTIVGKKDCVVIVTSINNVIVSEKFAEGPNSNGYVYTPRVYYLEPKHIELTLKRIGLIL